MGRHFQKVNRSDQIITPVFAEGNLLRETFAAVQNQTFKNFEWLLVNDGSTDNETCEIVKELASNYDWIKYLAHSENKGLPAARNTGIANSNSSYLFFLDGDDLIDPTFIEKAFLFLE